MMHVREMRMTMGHCFVLVPVGMFRAGRHRGFVIMLMMFVMGMFMFVLHQLVGMLVRMMFCQMQPDAERHQYPGSYQACRNGLSEQDCQCCADEGSNGEVSSCPRRAEVAQSDHE